MPEGPAAPPAGFGYRLRRAAQRALALGGIRVPLRLLLELSRTNPVPALVTVPAARRVLVLAPHMDDETIGCGGAILAHRAAGAAVEVAFLTDGSRGFLPQELARRSEAERIAIRREEAGRACEILDVAGLHYLDLPDGRSQVGNGPLRRLQDLFCAVKPDLVYLPFMTDAHRDHRILNELFFDLVRENTAWRSLPVCCYEVWTPLYPNSIIDITAYMDTKMTALACYESQLRLNDYLSSVRGLNAYRAIANHSRGFAEAFYQTSASQYLQMRRLADGR